MEHYVIKKKNKNRKLNKFDFDETGYVFKPNIKSPNLIKITSLSITNLEITNSILIKKLDKSFRKLSVLNDEEATSGDATIALNELAKEKGIITRKYREYLKKEEQEKYLKRLKVLEKEVKEKLVTLKLEEEKVYEEELEKGHSR